MDHCMQIALLAGSDAIINQSNFIFSPASIRAALALLATGTNGETLCQLLAFLGCQDFHQLNETNARLLANMRTWHQLYFTAGMFVDNSLFLRPEFVHTATSFHGAFLRTVDFKNQVEDVAAEVNDFIARVTRGRIRQLVIGGSFSSETRMIFANTVHFKAKWAREFDRLDNGLNDFHRLDGTTVRVPFMSSCGSHYAACFEALGGYKVLQCFYRMEGRDGRLDPRAPCFCMLIFLPDRRNGLEDLLRAAGTDPDFVMRSVPRREQVVIPCEVPKFKFSHSFDAKDVLGRLGLAAPFHPEAADLSSTVSNMPPEGLFVSVLHHICNVDVEEEGTTAAGATLEVTSPGCDPRSRSYEPMSFVADHPFLFAIVEYEKAEVLFFGHILDPSLCA